MVIESVDRFLEGYEDKFREFDVKGEQPSDFIAGLKDLGLFGLIIPEQYGGIGLSNAAYSRVLQQSSRHDASTSLTIGAHSSIGMKGVLLFGTEEQKSKYLPKLASGEMIAAFCLTESGSGSDAASIKTNATKNGDGSWTLNGEKIWITNGAFADLFTVFARTEGEGGKLTAFIVERAFAGVSNGPKEDKMGIRASATTTISLNNVKVPAENVLGEVGKGFKVAMSILNSGRTGLGGGCVGGMKRLIEMASKQANERKQFGRAISEFPLIKEKIAQMTVDCFATEATVQTVANLVDRGYEDYSVEAAISKVFATEALWRAGFEALQIAGGNGFMREYPYERIVRDSRIFLIFEGTNEILRLYIALSGLKEAGDYLKGVSSGIGNFMKDPIKGFGVLSEYAGRKFAQLTPVGRDVFNLLHPSLKEEALTIERYTQQFARACEKLLSQHGKGIVGMQYPTKRIADINIDLFVGSCVLARVDYIIKSRGGDLTKCQDELNIAKIFVRAAKRRINFNLRRLDRNEDQQITELADAVLRKQRFDWDLI
jgi:alkylation response protein AidB-like acyl-CoA dehydrogenase